MFVYFLIWNKYCCNGKGIIRNLANVDNSSLGPVVIYDVISMTMLFHEIFFALSCGVVKSACFPPISVFLFSSHSLIGRFLSAFFLSFFLKAYRLLLIGCVDFVCSF